MVKSKLIVIEGSDASGKKVQSRLLIEKLATAGSKVEGMSFPVYNSPTGCIVSKYLNNEFGPVASIDPKIASTWYALNRYEFKQTMLGHLHNGDVIVCDRYVESNMGHQGGKIGDDVGRGEFFRWCADMEYGVLGLPQPDCRIFLHVPWWMSKRLLIERGANLDGHEADDQHLQAAENAYLQLTEDKTWVTVECCENDQMRTPEDISNEVYMGVLSAISGL